MRGNKNKTAVVVGGGLTGIIGSILLADKFESVYIIEKDPFCGGLLKSIEDNLGINYDLGTHIPCETLIPEIDQILFGSSKNFNKEWTSLGNLRQGNFFAEKWNLETCCIDARNLNKNTYNKGIIELLSRTKKSNKKNIKSFLNETIGPTFSNNIILPVIKKLYDTDPKTLTCDSSVNYFGLGRLIALTPEITNKLKELEVFDNKLSYHTRHQRQKSSDKHFNCFYPKKSVGIQSWINYLLKKAIKKDVKVINKEFVEKIFHNSRQIKSIKLGNCQKKINCDFLLWTAPTSLIFKAANLPLNKNNTNIKFRTSNIFHFSYDLPLLNRKSFFLWNWDVNCKGFRITLYPNMQRKIRPSLNNVTVEVLSKKKDSIYLSLEEIDEELKKINLVSKKAKILSKTKQIVHNTFPVPTFEFQKKIINDRDKIYKTFKNIYLSGRFAGKNWFQNDVIKETYFEIKNRFG